MYLICFRVFFNVLIFVAFATILSNSIMICIVIYEQFVSIKRLVVIRKNLESKQIRRR